jgi:hypothetical protein
MLHFPRVPSRAFTLVLLSAAVAACSSSRSGDEGSANAVTDMAEDPLKDLKVTKLGDAPAYKGHLEVLDAKTALYMANVGAKCVEGGADLVSAEGDKPVRSVLGNGAWTDIRVSPDKKWIVALGVADKGCDTKDPMKLVVQSLVEERSSTLDIAPEGEIDFAGEDVLVFEPGSVRAINPATSEQKWTKKIQGPTRPGETGDGTPLHVVLPTGLFVYTETEAALVAVADGAATEVTGLPAVEAMPTPPNQGPGGGSPSSSSSSNNNATNTGTNMGPNAGTTEPSTPNKAPEPAISAQVLYDDSVLVSSQVADGTFSLHRVTPAAKAVKGEPATAAMEIATGLVKPAQLAQDGVTVLYRTADPKNPTLETLNVLPKDAQAAVTVTGLADIETVFLDDKGQPVSAVGGDAGARVFATVTDGKFTTLAKLSATNLDVVASLESSQLFYFPEAVQGDNAAAQKINVRPFAADGAVTVINFDAPKHFLVDPAAKPSSLVAWNDAKATIVPLAKPQDAQEIGFGQAITWNDGVLWYMTKAADGAQHVAAVTSDGFFTRTLNPEEKAGDAALDSKQTTLFITTSAGIHRVELPKYEVGKAKPGTTTGTTEPEKPEEKPTTPKTPKTETPETPPPVGANPSLPTGSDDGEPTTEEPKKEKKSVEAGCSMTAGGHGARDASTGLLFGFAGLAAMIARRRRRG